MMEPKQKPTRVERTPVHVFDCPLCHSQVTGEVEVEVHLAGVTLGNVIEEDTSQTVEATAHATTRIRRLTVAHDCTGPEQSVVEAGS